jgi:hypothetical protein
MLFRILILPDVPFKALGPQLSAGARVSQLNRDPHLLADRSDVDGAVYRIDHAREFGKHAIAGRIDEASVMLLDLRIDILR